MLMYRGFYTKLERTRKYISLFLIIAILVGGLGDALIRNEGISKAKAAQTTIDSDPFLTATSHLQSGSQTVFIDDQTGYKFFVDAPGYCVYRKTTDGGATWSSTTTVDAQTDCIGITVWYDRWTPGDSGNYIHIMTMDTSASDHFYNRLDTASGDTLLMGSGPVDVSTNSANSVATFAAGVNRITLTKATDGTLYTAAVDASDSYVVKCSSNCNLTTGWTEAGTNPFGRTNNYAVLMPIGNGDILAIHRDIVLEDIGSKVFHKGTGLWDVATTTFETNALDNTTYDVGMAAVASINASGTVYVAYIASSTVLGADDSIKTAIYQNNAWTVKKQVVRYTEKALTNVAIALDSSNDDVYVAYSARTTPGTAGTGNVYWRKSMDDMATWGYEQGPVNSSASDIYGIDVNLISNERIYATWFDNTNADVVGETLINIFPGIHVTTSASPELNSADSYTQNTIDLDPFLTGTSHLLSGSQTVFVSDQVGYKFFVDAPGYCVYRKTTNGGTTWGATTTVDSQPDCIEIYVWYDKWTPGSASSSIHIVTMDTGNDDIWYNRLDPGADSLLLGSTPVSMLTGSAQGGTSLTAGENFTSITRGTDGTLYALSNDGTGASDSFIVECTISCNTAANWTEPTTTPLDTTASDQNLLLPLSGGNIMLINRDISANVIRYKTWNNSITTWSGAWTNIDSSATINATYDVGMAAVVSTSTNDIYFAYIANNATPGTDDELRTALYSGGTWTTKTKISTSTVIGLTNVSIALDSSNDDVYVAYSAQATGNTAATANVLWKKSTDDMNTWGYEQGPVDVQQSDVYGVGLNVISSERLYVSWFDNTQKDIYGATIQDLPSTDVASTGIQIPSVLASTTDVYIGSVFAVYNTNDSQSYDVTGITITENGSIDASTDVTNVKLLYEMDNVSPYDCASVSYGGSESQFGTTDANGFSAANGVSSFTGTTVSVSTTTALCIYPVMDILDSADSSTTIEIEINDPVSDVTVTSSTAGPSSAQALASTTIVYNDNPTQIHFHFRSDNGSESTASSTTSGVEDTAITAMKQGSTTRLRVEISNEGSSSTPAMQYRLEFGTLVTSCSEVSTWTDVGAANDAFDMFDTSNLTDGANTTNIATSSATSSGGVTDANPIFLTPNAGVKDTSSQTANIILSPVQFVELEYSIKASTTAPQGTTYCFRTTNAGTALDTYSVYPMITINSDVAVTVATSSQNASTTIPATNYYVGSAFVVTENSTSRNVTNITITENGTVDGLTGLSKIRLKYDLDTTSPYNCAGESYTGNELQFGATSTSFTSANGTSTFTDSVAISTTSTMCLYTVLDVASSTQNGETIDIIMENPSINLLVSGGGSVSPSITRDMNGSTTLVGPILTQTHFHWRNNDGGESTSTSMTNGVEDTPITNVSQSTALRLRFQISNEGLATSSLFAPRLEYGTKITTCSAVSSWIDVGATGGAFDMYDSVFLVDATNTIDISNTIGGVTNENTSFKTPNSALKETSSLVASTSLNQFEYLEAEFSFKQTTDAGYDVPYCFRLSANGTALNAYTNYALLTTSPERDFEIQRGTVTIAAAATTSTITAGVDYVAPSASTSAFIRITNLSMTGAGHNTGVVTAQNASNTTAYIVNPSNIMTSVTFARTGITDNTRISWEIVEFIGEPGSDNEIIVRSQTAVQYGAASPTSTGPVVSGISDDNDVVVFITGQQSPDPGSTNYESVLSTSRWDSTLDTPVIERSATGSDAVRVSYAVVEFTGINWFVQRNEHTYTAAGTTEEESITAVGSLAHTFTHIQKRNNANLNGTDEFGAEVRLSGIGTMAYFLESGATNPSGQVSVAWIIENTQSTNGEMNVARYTGNTINGTPPFTLSHTITTLTDITNTSIFANARSSVAGTTHPRAQAGIRIASTTAFEIWRSNVGSTLTYRAEIVEWPTAGLAIRQNNFQFYVHNNLLTPTEPWPGETGPLGVNQLLTAADNPLGEGERIRIRMSIQAENATFPAGTKAFRLQYAPMVTTCTAITEASWQTLGNAASSTVWRGYNATGTTDGTQLSGNPFTLGDLLLTQSDVAGTLEEVNDTDVNTYAAQAGEDTEYDWIIEQNGATAETYYCFRMVESDGTPLSSYSTTYPQLRTASFTPRSQNWRWYDDENDETPTTTLAIENVAPTDITNGQALKLRVAVKETKNIARDDVRFKLQYSEYSNFLIANDVVATSSCIATSTWCYANGGGIDNAKITTATLSDADSCVASVGNGCGTHNESPTTYTGFRHQNSASAEYEFTIQSAGPRVNRVYYFRLYDIVQNLPVTTNSGESYPSLVTEGASLVFTMSGIASSTVVAGVTLDINATPNQIPFGTVPINTSIEGAHRLVTDANGTQGYQVLMTLAGDLVTSGGATIKSVTGTNASPLAWNTGCASTATSCLGYHTTDATLYGSSARFSAPDTYAAFSTTTAEEVSYSSQPVVGDTTDVVFRIYVRQLQDAGRYVNNIRYISIPIF